MEVSGSLSLEGVSGEGKRSVVGKTRESGGKTRESGGKLGRVEGVERGGGD